MEYEPTPPPEFEITEVIHAEMNLQVVQLTPSRHATFFGPRTQAQRLVELEMVFASIKAATTEIRARGYWAGIILISLNGHRFWYLPFQLFPTIVTGLPADALEVLELIRQIAEQTDQATVAILAPGHRVKLLHLSDDTMHGETYTWTPVSQPTTSQTKPPRRRRLRS